MYGRHCITTLIFTFFSPLPQAAKEGGVLSRPTSIGKKKEEIYGCSVAAVWLGLASLLGRNNAFDVFVSRVLSVLSGFLFFFFLGSGRQDRKCQAWLSLGRSIDSRGT